MKEPAGTSLPILIACLVMSAAPLAAQAPTCRDYNRIEIDAGNGTMRRYSFNGTGTHRYATADGAAAKDAPKSGAFANGVYTCWHPEGWKNVEIAFDAGIRLATFDAAGKPALTLRSDGLQPKWHANGRCAFAARDGRFLFCNADGTVAADVRLCQEVWRTWNTEVEVDENAVWHELLHDQHARTMVPRLVDGVRHPDPWVRAHACEAIETFGAEAVQAVPALRQALGDDRFWLVRQRAAQALWQLGPLAHEAVPELVRVASDRNEAPTTRALAVRALGDIGDKAAAAVPALEAAAKLAPPELQVEVTAALGWIAPAGRTTVRTLTEHLADPKTALPAAFSLFYRYRGVAHDAREAVQRELKLHGETMTDLAMQLSVLLFHIDPDAPQPAWAEGAHSTKPWLPRRALTPEALFAFCMLDADPDEIDDAIDTLAECPDSYFREQMAAYPSKLGPEAHAAIPGLVHALGMIGSNTNQWAMRALAHIGQPAIPALSAALQSENTRWRIGHGALEALIAMGVPAIPAITSTLANKDASLQQTAASALGRFGPAAKEALPALRQALQSSSEDLRAAAALAIARIEGAAARSPRQSGPR